MDCRYGVFRASAQHCLQEGRRYAVIVVAPALVVLVGCDQLESTISATQVAAQVNAEEITVHQINAVLARTPDVTAERAPRVKREILDRLIDRQLAVQEAKSRKLDRAPEVLRALETARAEILARAFSDDIARGEPKPTPDEVRQYYMDHPELFAQRRIFVLEEIGLGDAGDALPELQERVAKARSLGELATWLGARNIPYAESRGVRAAEQLPLPLLPRLQAAKDGELVLLDQGERIQIVRVVASKSAPVDEATAAPRIGQYLFNKRASEAVSKAMEQIRKAADIRYQGEFATHAPAPDENASVVRGVQGLK